MIEKVKIVSIYDKSFTGIETMYNQYVLSVNNSLFNKELINNLSFTRINIKTVVYLD